MEKNNWEFEYRLNSTEGHVNFLLVCGNHKFDVPMQWQGQAKKYRKAQSVYANIGTVCTIKTTRYRERHDSLPICLTTEPD